MEKLLRIILQKNGSTGRNNFEKILPYLQGEKPYSRESMNHARTRWGGVRS